MANSIPVHTLYGRPADGSRIAHTGSARLASASAPYVGRGNKCSANEDTCEGMRAKGTDFCMGHLRSKDNKFLLETETKGGADASG